MTVKELIKQLELHDENKEVKFVYDGPDSFQYLDIKAVEEKEYFVFIDSSEYETRG